MKKYKGESKEWFKKRLYAFVLELLGFIDKLSKDIIVRRISDQLIRSGTSILANYIEGQSASSKKDFANFFNHSLKSANESKVWLALLRDTKKAPKESTDKLLKELEEISKIFASSLLTLRGKR